MFDGLLVVDEYGYIVERNLQLQSVLAMQLLRIVQEALNNIRKHAESNHVRIALSMVAKKVRISVVDDGKGYELPTSSDGMGFGLTSMQERAKKVGGTPILGQGTSVVVTVPLGAI